MLKCHPSKNITTVDVFASINNLDLHHGGEAVSVGYPCTEILSRVRSTKVEQILPEGPHVILRSHTLLVDHRAKVEITKVQQGFGMAAWSMGAPHWLLGLLPVGGMVRCIDSILESAEVVADEAVDLARVAASCPRALSYDHCQMTSSIFVEQTLNTKATITSGTVAVISVHHIILLQNTLLIRTVAILQKSRGAAD